jgi:cytochrome b6-f complex iron-sulfur subunit
VQYLQDKKSIYCACHGGQYDAETGKNIAGPPPKPLAPLKAEVVDGKIIVSRA